MAQLIKDQYQKDGAVFASAEEAFADQQSTFSPSLLATINYQQLLEDGIFLQPIYPEWDQETFILSICKLVTSVAEYEAARTINKSEVIIDAEQGGWVFAGRIVTDVE